MTEKNWPQEEIAPGVFVDVDPESLLMQTREYRVGKHLLDTAQKWGWPDDGEGAFEYVQRISYAQGLEDGQGYARTLAEDLGERIGTIRLTLDTSALEFSDTVDFDPETILDLLNDLDKILFGLRKVSG